MILHPHSDQVVDELRENGFAVARGFLGSSELAEVIEQLERYVREIVPRLPEMDVFYEHRVSEGMESARAIKMLSRMQHHDEYFGALLEDDRFRTLGDRLWPVPVVSQDIACFDKPTLNSEPTPAHQDGYYFIIEPCEAVTMWLALDRVDEENGCLYYVRGSHRRGMRPHARTSTLGFSQGITDYPRPGDLRDEVMMTADPGDLILHDGLTVHRAGGNRSRTRSRRALGLVYFSERARKDPEAHAAYQKSLAVDLRREGKI